MYRQEVHSTASKSPSFVVCLPGHNGIYPKDNQCSQGDYYLLLKPTLQLDPSLWTCSIRSICYSNSYSTLVPETEIDAIYMMTDTDFHAIPAQKLFDYTLKPGVRMRDLVHGYKIWTRPMYQTDTNEKLRIKKGLYYHLDELLDDLNSCYKKAGVNATFRRDGKVVVLSLKREKETDPWIIPYFEGELADRIGLPQIGSARIEPMLDTIKGFGLQASYTIEPSSFVRNKTRNIGLYTNFLEARFPGLNENELIRLPGRMRGYISDTNIIDFKHPTPLKLKDGNIALVRIQFKDEEGNIVFFPIGQNMIVFEFNKNENKDVV